MLACFSGAMSRDLLVRLLLAGAHQGLLQRGHPFRRGYQDCLHPTTVLFLEQLPQWCFSDAELYQKQVVSAMCQQCVLSQCSRCSVRCTVVAPFPSLPYLSSKRP